MKSVFLLASAAVFCALGTLPAQTTQQPATVVTAPEAVGTVTGYDATTQSLAVAVPNAATPFTCLTTNKTQLMDGAGKSVPVEFLKPGAPVTVYYVPKDGKMIAEKIVIRVAAPVDNIP